MTYVPGNPLTGFTVSIDGDIAVIERIAKALMKAIHDEIAEVEREQRREILSREPIRTIYQIRPLMPFQGTIMLRTTADPPAPEKG